MDADGSDQYWTGIEGFAAIWSPDGDRFIYTSNIDGTDDQQLTSTNADESFPDWSPDGSQIAYSASTGNWNKVENSYTYELYVMDADETNVRQLTNNTANDGNPRWSPDGSLIVFSSDVAKRGHWEIYVMDADGPNVGQVTHTSSDATAINPVWQPEGILSISSVDSTTIVPDGTPVALDGTFSPGEWDHGLRQEFTDGGELFLMQNGNYLYLGIHENFDDLTVTTVFLEFEDEIFVLHSSGSLETAIFERRNNGWQLTQPFTSSLHGVTSQSVGDEQKRQDFLDTNRWLANLGSMTGIEEIEYQKAVPSGPFHIAIAYLRPPDFGQVAWWPANLSDDCLNINLLQGNITENMDASLVLQFAPETWVTFTIP